MALKPIPAIEKVAAKLFEDTMERERFIDSIKNPTPKPSALLWMGAPQALTNIPHYPAPSKFPNWITLCPPEFSPGKTVEHEQGAFYCMDGSSAFSMLPLLELEREKGEVFCVVDVCASPGGKSIFASRALQPSCLISNEAIGKRVPALLSNLKRCRIKSATVTNADPVQLSRTREKIADLVIVDAPCSGQSLAAKGGKELGSFSNSVIRANVGRQRRILAHASSIVIDGGFLLYSTCTFSLEENEDNVAWFLEKFPNFSIVREDRMWPAENLGAGSYFALLRNTSDRTGSHADFDLSDLRHWDVY